MVERLWRREGLKAPKRQPKRRRLWLGDGSCIRLRPEYRGHVWSYDFVEDQMHNGRKFRMLNIIDEFSRECPALVPLRRFRSNDVIDVLGDLFIEHGPPEHIRSDNGIQFAEQPCNRNTAFPRQMRFDMICEANGIEHRLTKPNHPWTNPGRADEPHHQGRDRQTLPLRQPRAATRTPCRFHRCLHFGRWLKTLSGLTPYEYIAKIWTSQPDRIIINPIHQMPGLNTYGRLIAPEGAPGGRARSFSSV